MINVLIDLQVRVKLDALNAECKCEEWEVRAFNNSHVFLVSLTFVVVESGNGDEGVSEVTLFEELF